MNGDDENINEEWVSSKNPWLITIAVMIATFISVLDSTIANVALPHMAGSFSASNQEAIWILTSYLIASGVVLPSVDWFSKIFGRKKYFMACIVIFTVASIFCGFAQSLSQMVFARIIQGLGGGALMPISQSILLESFPKEKRGMAMSVFGIGILIAPIIGPLIGGWLTDCYSWHWIFFINIPFGILALIFSEMFIEDPPYARKRGIQKIDYLGFAFLIAWLTTLQIVLDKGQNADWFNSSWVCWTSAISAVSMVGFFVSQMKNDHAIVDLSTFKDENYSIGTALMTIVMGIMYASMALMPLFLQNLLGYTAFLSGYAVMPRGVGCLAAIAFTGFFSSKINDKFIVSVGLALLGISCLMCGYLNLNIAIINIVVPNLIFGVGMGLCMIGLTTLSVETLKNYQMTNATGLQSLLKETGGAIGTSIVGTMLARYSQAHQFAMVENLSNLNVEFVNRINTITAMLAKYLNITVAKTGANYLMYAELLKQSALWSFMDTFRILALVCFIITPLVFLMKEVSHDGEEDFKLFD